jgi:type IV pilus assembly protein PilM
MSFHRTLGILAVALTLSVGSGLAAAQDRPSKGEQMLKYRKAVYQTMRSVCNDLVTEIHRSLSYFGSLEKESRIVRVIAMGNTMKLHGLPQFLSKHLEMNVQAADKFKALDGPSVLTAPAFKDNVLSFPVCYGLACQGLEQARLKTNLLPREILKDRLVREKKPWVVAAAAAVLLALAISFFGHWQAWNSANVNHQEFKSAIGDADSEEVQAKDFTSTYDGLVATYKEIDDVGKHLTQNLDGRVAWLEMLKAVNACLPIPGEEYVDKPTYKRPELHIEAIDCERFEKLEDWFADIKDEYLKGHAADAAAAAANAAAADGAAAAATPAAPDTGPTGPGWVIQMRGFHLFNEKLEGAQFVRDTLLKNLENGTVELPVVQNGKVTMEQVTMKELGIEYPVLLPTTGIDKREIEAEDQPVGLTGIPKVPVGQLDFIVQFVWKPTPPGHRAENAKAKKTSPSVASDGSPSRSERGGE